MEHKQGKRLIPSIQQLVSISQGRLCARNSAEKRCLREAGTLSMSMKTQQKICLTIWQRTVFRDNMDTTNNLAQRAISFFNVASETVYHDLFLFIRQKREKKVPPSAGQLLFVFLFIGNFQLKGPCLNFLSETTSFMKQSAFHYKIKRAFFGKKKK